MAFRVTPVISVINYDNDSIFTIICYDKNLLFMDSLQIDTLGIYSLVQWIFQYLLNLESDHSFFTIYFIRHRKL